MLDHIIKSRLFEKDFFWLRQKIPFLSRRYNEYYNINILTHSNALSHSKQIELNVAQNALRSLESACREQKNAKASMPKKLWLYWNSSLESAPEVVKISIESWTKLNPDYEIILLNDDNLKKVLGFDFNAVFKLSTVNLGFAMKADILRLYLLSTYGGVWADTTTFCLQPLSTWLDKETETNSFFAFRHKTNQTRPLEAWFIAAHKASKITKHTLALFIEHLFKSRQHSLFISNSIKKIGLKDSENTRFFKDSVNTAETKGFMPYFSICYFFNEALNQPETMNNWVNLLKTTNNDVVNYEPLEEFKNAYVAKLTYKKGYQESHTFKERVAYIKTLF
ncbi:capsular polysaccharide synthesis protein [Aliivibrio logei]|uniref:Capsular biosynthesis protein n=1 Tax=Aliivibrio logei TaxID=688 RepID=A0A1B9NVL7_ALILO|nr:capsular polysaccharide synthesis protein [Aliivibrio logei]OCH18596.1 hypothetical protein A6E04_01875 [Aliivibrio logei]